jgi:hypothetical protein
MQVTPSNNLLNALSGLQANRRPASPAAGAASFQAAVQQTAGTTAPAGQTVEAAATRQATPAVAQTTAQSAPQRRSPFLGQNLDITV